MDARVEAVLARYNERLAEERSRWSQLSEEQQLELHDEFLLPVGEDTARLLHALIVGRHAKSILELGTSFGYSTLFLADAARNNGGRVVTIELSADKQNFARQQLAEAGIEAFVEWRVGDALMELKSLEGDVDFVLMDLWSDVYSASFELLYPRLADKAVVVADNMLEPKDTRPQADAYRRAVIGKGDMSSVLLPIGAGIEISCRWFDPPLPSLS